MAQKIKQDRNIGNTLRRLRMEANLTQEELVAKLQLDGVEISRSIYSQIECGTYSIRVSELDALSRILKSDYNTLFDEV